MAAPVLVPAAIPRVRATLAGLMQASMHDEVRRLAGRSGIAAELTEAPALLAARVESRCPEFLLLDTDLLGCPDALCRLARSLRPDVIIVALACFWSDREEALRACVDAVMHKPLREEEWRPLFGAVLARPLAGDARAPVHRVA